VSEDLAARVHASFTAPDAEVDVEAVE